LIRDFLPPAAHYVCVEPSEDWFSESWQVVSDAFPSLKAPAEWVRGLGERLPFANETFDAVLSIFSLNHCVAPEEAVREMMRVLRPGGRCFWVLEEMPWNADDVRRRVQATVGWHARARLLAQVARHAVFGWPTQEDHLPLSERGLLRAAGGALQHREWQGSYLVLDLLKG
jgi:SAM-dependent methyltransferase